MVGCVDFYVPRFQKELIALIRRESKFHARSDVERPLIAGFVGDIHAAHAGAAAVSTPIATVATVATVAAVAAGKQHGRSE